MSCQVYIETLKNNVGNNYCVAVLNKLLSSDPCLYCMAQKLPKCMQARFTCCAPTLKHAKKMQIRKLGTYQTYYKLRRQLNNILKEPFPIMIVNSINCLMKQKKKHHCRYVQQQISSTRNIQKTTKFFLPDHEIVMNTDNSATRDTTTMRSSNFGYTTPESRP